MELKYIKQDDVKSIMGNKPDTFIAGDIFFIGDNLPYELKKAVRRFSKN